jgi:hypothetical protein
LLSIIDIHDIVFISDISPISFIIASPLYAIIFADAIFAITPLFSMPLSIHAMRRCAATLCLIFATARALMRALLMRSPVRTPLTRYTRCRAFACHYYSFHYAIADTFSFRHYAISFRLLRFHYAII